MISFAALDLHISIASEKLFEVWGISVTNAMFTGLIGLIIMLAVFGYATYKLRKQGYNRFIGLIQWVFEGLISSINSIITDAKLARKVTPYAVTIFFFVLINYWLSILPGMDTISYNGVPVIRSLTADLNFTLSIAILTAIMVQMYAVKYLTSLGNAKRYFKNPIKDPIGAFEGILELIGEVSRGTALALRLFGNAFAGEVLLIVIAALTSYFASITLPFFMAFELSVIFTSLAVSHDHSPAPHTKADK